MPFATVPGLKGKVYVPEKTPGSAKKHPCRDCFACQQCSDDRCRVCLQSRLGGCSKGLQKKSGFCQSRFEIIR